MTILSELTFLFLLLFYFKLIDVSEIRIFVNFLGTYANLINSFRNTQTHKQHTQQLRINEGTH